MTGFLLVLILAAPWAVLALCFVPSLRPRALAWQWLAPAPSLVAGLIGVWGGPFETAFPALRLDAPSALLLTVAALLWIVVGAGVFRDRHIALTSREKISWLLTMIGSLGVFIADDLVTFYLVYALVSIPAYGLFAFSDDPEKKRAGAVYMAFAIAGEALLLLAFALLAVDSPKGLRIAEIVAALPASPHGGVTLALIVAGFGMKMGLAPFNGWMPLNYAAAPIPAAAVLSGAGVKAGVIGLIRFLPLGVPMAGWGEALAALGFFSAFYGAALGLTQQNPKTVLAYSSISQMGVIAAALGLGLASGEAGAANDMAFYASNHLLVKAALFLTVGAFAVSAAPRTGWPLALAAALALSLAGLPLSGGALAKLASKGQFASGWAAALATLSSIATALLMTHFVTRLATPASKAAEETPAALARFWPALALGALLLPWVFAAKPGEALSFAKIWDGLWPVAVGVGLAAALKQAGWLLPRILAGDSIVVFESGFARLLRLGRAFEDVDDRLRQWPAAGVSMLLIALVLAFAASGF
jgi:formate hydrogenlyase subunit 3/multisubunit Na+/H+ antiporter MnhD subunit